MTNLIVPSEPYMFGEILNLSAIIYSHQTAKKYILIFFFLAYFLPSA